MGLVCVCGPRAQAAILESNSVCFFLGFEKEVEAIEI